ncbi:MAG TPA: hypothetical protein VE987_06060 [Polyangiaceae bacterium]|nr:hypothetical protein [Polyangiaceae bacterium]
MLDGDVCLPAPSQASSSDATTIDSAIDATAADSASLDSAKEAEAGALVEGGADAGGDVRSGDATSPDSSRPDGAIGAADADATAPLDGATESGADAADGAGGGDAYVIGPSPDCSGAPDVSGASLVALDGGLRELVIDPCHSHVYVSDDVANRIDDYSVAAAALEPPISVGSEPNGFDITPDGLRLYVANTGGTNVSVVDLTSRQELRRVSFTSNFSGDTPLSLAIARDGKALFSTTFAGSGFGGRLLSLDLASEAIVQETGFYINGTTTEATQLKASADHSVIGIVAGDISSAPVFVYQTSTAAFSPEHDLNGFVSRVAVSADGTRVLVDGTFVLDDSLNLLGTIPGATTVWAAFGPSAGVAYRTAADHIDVLDTGTFLVTGSIPVTADTLAGAAGSNVGNLAASSDGRWLAVISDHGLSLVPVP